jgi:serine/threonine protein kinase
MTSKYTFVGEGTSGRVYFDKVNKTVFKKFRYIEKKSNLESKEKILDKIDPKRDIFGSKILKYETKGGDLSTGIVMVYQGINLEKTNLLPSLHILKKLFLNLLHGLIKLTQFDYVHGDIKLDNVVYNSDKKRLKFIDYDFMNEQRGKLCYDILRYDYNYIHFVWPPEIWYKSVGKHKFSKSFLYLVNILYRNKILISPINPYKKKYGYYNYNELLALRGDVFLFIHFIETGQLKFRPIGKWLLKFVQFINYKKKYPRSTYDIQKFDIYGLGLVALDLFYKDFPEFRPLIFSMIHPNYKLRISPLNAYKKWYSIVFK